MKNRIKKIRKDFDMTQQEFADRIGVKRNSYANYETGRNTPIDAIILSICREFNVNEEWIRTGKGDPYISKSRNNEIKEYVDGIQASEEFKLRLFHVLTKLNDDEWAVLEDIAKALAETSESRWGTDSVPQHKRSPDTVADLEDEYKKSILNPASDKESTASNTTEGTESDAV